MNESTPIHIATESDSKQLGEPVSEAFFNDPMAVYLMPDESKRRSQLKWFFSTTYRYCQRWGEVHTNDSFTAGSAWLKPGHTSMTSLNLMRIGFCQAPFRLGMTGFKNLGKFSDEADSTHKRLMPDDHWYLLALGVAPSSQKSGLGTAALSAGLQKAASSNLPVYLETMTEQNVEYYLKRDFRVAEEYILGSQVRTWAMIKDQT